MSDNKNLENERPSQENDPRISFQTREEYIKALDSWVNQARMWQNISSCFPYYLMFNNFIQSETSSITSTLNRQQEIFNQNNMQARNLNQGPYVNGLLANEGYEFAIPPMWKRFLAETVDFLILFVIKLMVTIVAIEITDVSSFFRNWHFMREDYEFNLSDPHFGTEITTGLVMLEGIHRLIVCAYEVYWLRGADPRFCCATPGKYLLGITVVVATRIRPVENQNNRQKVLVYPAKDLGFIIACERSFLKNFILAVMFPLCFALVIFQYNQTGYDVFCNTVVVEYDPDPPKRNWLMIQ